MTELPTKVTANRKEYDKKYRQSNAASIKQYQKDYYRSHNEPVLIRLDANPDIHNFILSQVYWFNATSLTKLNTDLRKETDIVTLSRFQLLLRLHLQSYLHVSQIHPGTMANTLPMCYQQLIDYLTELITYLSRPK